MNERIRELKEQAFNFVAKQNMCKKEYFWENIRHNPELQDSVDAKFAELMLVEFCDVVKSTAIELAEHYIREGCSEEEVLMRVNGALAVLGHISARFKD